MTTVEWAVGVHWMRKTTRRSLLYALSGLLTPRTILTATDDWQKDVEFMLNQFMSCKDPIDDQSPCNYFLARALKRIYNISDFDQPGKPGQYLSANQIGTYLAVSGKWTKLGIASDQNALNQAKGYADVKKAIVASMQAQPNDHVAIILPGPLSLSSSWKLKVPNSASFFLKKPQNSYVGKPLSFAFKSEDTGSVAIYGRNY
jgi:hypothetical protein